MRSEWLPSSQKTQTSAVNWIRGLMREGGQWGGNYRSCPVKGSANITSPAGGAQQCTRQHVALEAAEDKGNRKGTGVGAARSG